MTSLQVCGCLTGSGSGNNTKFSSCQHYCLQIDEQDALDRLAETDGAAAAAKLREDPNFDSAKVLPLCQSCPVCQQLASPALCSKLIAILMWGNLFAYLWQTGWLWRMHTKHL